MLRCLPVSNAHEWTVAATGAGSGLVQASRGCGISLLPAILAPGGQSSQSSPGPAISSSRSASSPRFGPSHRAKVLRCPVRPGARQSAPHEPRQAGVPYPGGGALDRLLAAARAHVLSWAALLSAGSGVRHRCGGLGLAGLGLGLGLGRRPVPALSRAHRGTYALQPAVPGPPAPGLHPWRTLPPQPRAASRPRHGAFRTHGSRRSRGRTQASLRTATAALRCRPRTPRLSSRASFPTCSQSNERGKKPGGARDGRMHRLGGAGLDRMRAAVVRPGLVRGGGMPPRELRQSAPDGASRPQLPGRAQAQVRRAAGREPLSEGRALPTISETESCRAEELPRAQGQA